MAELLFPVSAVAVTFFVLIPALTLLSRWLLAHKRKNARDWASFGSETTFALLVAPTLLPILWLTSSALHQSEAVAADACLVDHVQATTCSDAFILLGLLLGGIILSVGFRVWRDRPRVHLSCLDDDHTVARRVAAIVARDHELKGMRVVAVAHTPEPVFTLGWIRPLVAIDSCFIEASDDEMIRAALLHERAHVAGFDTFRGSIARLCLGANPVGWLLYPEFHHWLGAREAQCDGEAVHLGGEPLALAESILKAARFRCSQTPAIPQAAMLAGHDSAALKLRLALLMEEPPEPVRTRGHLILGLAVIAALATPHLQGLGVLEHFHFEVELLLSALI